MAQWPFRQLRKGQHHDVLQAVASPSIWCHRHQHFEDFVVLAEINFEDFAVFGKKDFEDFANPA